MSDIFAPLREPESVSSLAPEEVRRAGDRLRRRRGVLAVVGAACATAMVVGGISLVGGDRLSSDTVPEPVDPPAPQSVIPVEFDLADGLPRGSGDVASAPALRLCGESFRLAHLAIASQGIGKAERGDFTLRGLSVYPDAGTARSVATDLVARFEGCARSADDRRGTTSVRPTTYGDQGWVLERVAGAVDAPEVIEVVRLGTNLLVIQQREIHGIAVEALARGTGDQVAWLMQRQMCLLTDEGCAWRSDPDVLRPEGWGPWRLGMSREELEANGVALFGDAGECATVDLGSGEGLLSESDQLVTIQVPQGVTTPSGIGLGSSRDDVLEHYWFAEKNGDVMTVRASPTADYEIRLERGQVTQLTLRTVADGCLD